MKGTVSQLSLAIWTRQMATMLAAGIPLRRCIEAATPRDSPGLEKVCEKMLKGVIGGMTFSNSLAQHPVVFSPAYVAIVRAGETSGRLPATLDRLAQDGERQAKLTRQLLASLAYPICVLVFAAILFGMFLVWILPALAAVLDHLSVELPWLTRVFMSISRVVREPRSLALVGVPLLLIGAGWWRLWSTEPALRKAWGFFWRRTPGFGRLLVCLEANRILSLFAGLLRSGVPLLAALRVLRGVASDPRLNDAIEEVTRGVTEGRGLGEMLLKVQLFPAMVTMMIASGEESGSTASAMEWSAQMLEMEAEFLIQDLVALCEPFSLAILGGVAGVCVLAAFLPVVQLVTAML